MFYILLKPTSFKKQQIIKSIETLDKFNVNFLILDIIPVLRENQKKSSCSPKQRNRQDFGRQVQPQQQHNIQDCLGKAHLIQPKTLLHRGQVQGKPQLHHFGISLGHTKCCKEERKFIEGNQFQANDPLRHQP